MLRRYATGGAKLLRDERPDSALQQAAGALFFLVGIWGSEERRLAAVKSIAGSPFFNAVRGKIDTYRDWLTPVY